MYKYLVLKTFAAISLVDRLKQPNKPPREVSISTIAPTQSRRARLRLYASLVAEPTPNVNTNISTHPQSTWFASLLRHHHFTCSGGEVCASGKRSNPSNQRLPEPIMRHLLTFANGFSQVGWVAAIASQTYIYFYIYKQKSTYQDFVNTTLDAGKKWNHLSDVCVCVVCAWQRHPPTRSVALECVPRDREQERRKWCRMKKGKHLHDGEWWCDRPMSLGLCIYAEQLVVIRNGVGKCM